MILYKPPARLSDCEAMLGRGLSVCSCVHVCGGRVKTQWEEEGKREKVKKKVIIRRWRRCGENDYNNQALTNSK